MLQVVGPTRWFCLADTCITHVPDDCQAFCDEHWVQFHLYGEHFKTRGGLSEHYFIEMKKRDSANVRAKAIQSVVSNSVPACNDHPMTDGLGKDFLYPAANASPTNTYSMNTHHIRMPDGSDELVIHWELPNKQTYQQRIFRPRNFVNARVV